MSHTILCVEDEQDTGDLMKAILEHEGYVVIRAIDGRQAVDFLDSIQPPTLILLDVVAPFANGFKLLAMLRQKENWQQVPIVMISDDSYQPDIQRTLGDNAAAYVVKKPGLHNLLQTVRQVVNGLPDSPSGPGHSNPPSSVPKQHRSIKGLLRKAPPHNKPAVLIVEDHEDTASLLRLLLEQEGYRVIHTADGESAHRLTVTTAPPAVILLDLTLPAMTGLELLRIIRTTPEWQWTPVLILTADTRSETITQAANLGATKYVQKPFIAAQLLRSIRDFVPEAQPGLERGNGV